MWLFVVKPSEESFGAQIWTKRPKSGPKIAWKIVKLLVEVKFLGPKLGPKLGFLPFSQGCIISFPW